MAGALVSALLKRTSRLEFSGVEIAFEATKDPTKDSRLEDARRELNRQESLVKWNSRAAASLTFGQYIVGGVLASSFVQESLTPPVIGFLGVLVLMSSLIHQTYRPDLQRSSARQRVHRLRALIRKVEDDLFALKNEHAGAPSIYDIRQDVSAGLTRIEEGELIESEREATKAKSANVKSEADTRKVRTPRPRN